MRLHPSRVIGRTIVSCKLVSGNSQTEWVTPKTPSKNSTVPKLLPMCIQRPTPDRQIGAVIEALRSRPFRIPISDDVVNKANGDALDSLLLLVGSWDAERLS